MTKTTERRITRRTFLTGAGAATAGAAAAASCATTSVGPEPPAALPVAVHVGPPAGTPGTVLTRLTVNGTPYEAAVDPRSTVAEVLREQMGLTGTKVGCDRGECGSCTVLLNGRPVLSCMTLAIRVEGDQVLTVEGLSDGEKLDPLQQAFVDHHGVACGFCTPGMLLSAKALLDRTRGPSRDDIRAALAGNLCRCTGYQKIIESVEAASKLV